MVFGMSRFDYGKFKDSIFIDSCIVKQVDEIKFLGVTIDSSLTWKHHISQICSIISRNIGIMYKLRSKLSDSVLFTLYNVLILPHLMYCNIVWGCAGKTLLDRLFILEKRGIRI